MLIREIIVEGNRSNAIEGDINDLLISVRGNDLDSIDTGKIVAQLRSMGHSITASSLISFLEGNPLLQTATADTLTFKNTDMYATSGDGESKEQNREKVRSLAKKAAMKDIKQ